jgi:hypothetical protein
MATVLPLKPATTKAETRKGRRPARTSAVRRRAPAAGRGGVILVLIALSLSHLAHGVRIVTGCEAWEAMAMVVTAGTRAYKPVAKFANPALIVAFAWSAGLNAFAFSASTAAI